MGDEVKKAWESFNNEVVDKDASDEHREEIKRIFYSGVHAALMIISTIGNPDVPDDYGVNLLGSISIEVEDFFKELSEKVLNSKP